VRAKKCTRCVKVRYRGILRSMVRIAKWGGGREDGVSAIRGKPSSLAPARGWRVGCEKENTIVYKSRATISISKPSSRRQTVGPVYPQLSSVIQTSRRARGVSRRCAPFARASHSSYFVLRGGVDGRAPIIEPKPPISFRSAGFKIWKLHIKFSSTVIIAPALSNSPQ